MRELSNNMLPLDLVCQLLGAKDLTIYELNCRILDLQQQISDARNLNADLTDKIETLEE